MNWYIVSLKSILSGWSRGRRTSSTDGPENTGVLSLTQHSREQFSVVMFYRNVILALDMTDAEFREAYGRHKDMLYRFARRMTGSGAAAEDLVQDCFLMLWRNAAAYDPERGTLRGFLIGVARNLALKRSS